VIEITLDLGEGREHPLWVRPDRIQIVHNMHREEAAVLVYGKNDAEWVLDVTQTPAELEALVREADVYL
jgi:hypothetical protein